MAWIVGLPAIALAIGAAVTWLAARGNGWRWGWTAGPPAAVGEGTYRTAPVATRKPRRMPLVCRLAAVTSVAWGVLTTFVFAPAGVLFWLIAVSAAARGLLGVIAVLLVMVATIHGFVFGIRLMTLATPLAVRADSSVERVERAAIISAVHHLVVLFSFGLLLSGGSDSDWLWLAAVPCAIGLAHAGLLAVARRVLVRLDREDRTH